MNENIKISAEWDFIYGDGTVITRKNLIKQAGLNFIAGMLLGEYTSDIPFYLAMGTDSTPATVGGIERLNNETFRKIVSSKTRQGSMIRFRTFLQSNEANGDWKEFGIFMAGTELLNSGTILNHLVSQISKTQNTVLTVEVRITFRGE